MIFDSSASIEKHRKKIFKEATNRAQEAWIKEDALQNRPKMDRTLLTYHEERQLLSWYETHNLKMH